MRRPVLAVFLLILASSEYLSQVAARSQAKENETKHLSQDYTRIDGDHSGRGTRRVHALRDRKSNINNKMHDQKGSKGVYNGLRDRRVGIVPIWPAKNSWVEGSIYKKLGKQRKIQGFPKKEKLRKVCFFSVCFDNTDKKKKKKKKSKGKAKGEGKGKGRGKGKKKNNNNNENDNSNNFASNSKESSFNSPEYIPSFYHVEKEDRIIVNNHLDYINNHGPEFHSVEKTEPIDRIIVNNHLDYINNHGPEYHSVEKTEPIDRHIVNNHLDYINNHSPEFHSVEKTEPIDRHIVNNHLDYINNHNPENTPHKHDNFDPDDPHHQGDNDGGESIGLDDTHHETIEDNQSKNNDKLSKKDIDGHSEDIQGTTSRINPKCIKPYVREDMECETTSDAIDPTIFRKEHRQKRLEYKKRMRENRKLSEKYKKNSSNRYAQSSKGTNYKNRFLSHPLK